MNPVRSPRDAAAGIFLLLVSMAALWGGLGLPAGTLSHIGPGLLPRALALLTGLGGAGLIVGAFFHPGAALDRWRLREIVFVLGAALAFAFTIRPLGLVVAAPAAVLISALASRESKWKEILIFAAIISLFCIGLFKYLLRLPIPLAPWLVGY